jgi:hypothetical protein
MNQESQPRNVRRGFRFSPVALGLISSLVLVFFGGTTGEPESSIWITPAVILLLLITLIFAKKAFPKRGAWFQAGITFLLSAIGGVLLLVGIYAALLFASFDTEYAPGYSEKAFKSIKLAATEESVLSALGAPLSSEASEPYVEWIYSADRQPYFSDHGVASGTYTTVTFDRNARVKHISGGRKTSANTFLFGEGHNSLNLTGDDIERLKGTSQARIKEKFGSPQAIHEYKASKELSYSRSPSSSNYHLRKLGMDENGKVVHIWRCIYWD